MKILVLSIIIGLLTMSPVMAEKEYDREMGPKFLSAQDLREHQYAYASDFIGANLYITHANQVPRTVTEVPDEWEDVGNIDDLILTDEGKVGAALIDVGGFFGIGARTVAINRDALEVVRVEGDNGVFDDDDFYVVLRATRDELENAPEYERDN